jgi:hypothetical protein
MKCQRCGRNLLFNGANNFCENCGNPYHLLENEGDVESALVNIPISRSRRVSPDINRSPDSMHRRRRDYTAAASASSSPSLGQAAISVQPSPLLVPAIPRPPLFLPEAVDPLCLGEQKAKERKSPDSSVSLSEGSWHSPASYHSLASSSSSVLVSAAGLPPPGPPAGLAFMGMMPPAPVVDGLPWYLWVLLFLALFDGKIGDGAIFLVVDDVGFNPNRLTLTASAFSVPVFGMLLYDWLKKSRTRPGILEGNLCDKIWNILSVVFVLVMVVENGAVDYNKNQQVITAALETIKSWGVDIEESVQLLTQDSLSLILAFFNVLAMFILDQRILSNLAKKCRNALTQQFNIHQLSKVMAALGLASFCAFSYDFRRISRPNKLSFYTAEWEIDKTLKFVAAWWVAIGVTMDKFNAFIAPLPAAEPLDLALRRPKTIILILLTFLLMASQVGPPAAYMFQDVMQLFRRPVQESFEGGTVLLAAVWAGTRAIAIASADVPTVKTYLSHFLDKIEVALGPCCTRVWASIRRQCFGIERG